MAQQIINTGEVANDGTGESLRTAFTAVNDNFTQIWAAGPVGSTVEIYDNIITTTVTNQDLVLAANGIGNIQANSTIVPGTTGVYDIGAPGRTFQYVYGDYFVGNGALLTGISGTYSNALVASFLPTYTGNLVSLTGPVITTNNVVGGNVLSTGLISAAGNIAGNNLSVAGTITATGTIVGGNITSNGQVSVAGNVTATRFIGDGSLLTGIVSPSVPASALTGDVLSSNVLYSSLKVVDNLLYLDVDGNVTTSGKFIGSGAGLTNIPGANITGIVANAAYATQAGTAATAVTATTANTVTNNAQPNITSVGTLTSLSSSGNITGVRFIGSGAGLTNIPAANISGSVANAAYATVAGSAVTANTATTAGTVTTATQPNITSVGTLTSVAVSGNATTGNLLTIGQVSAAGNVSANYFIGNGALLTGIAATNVHANALVGDVLSSNVLYSSLKVVANLEYLNVDGNVTTAGRFIGSGAGLTNIPASSISGNIGIANTAITVTGNAQPNITSVGTLTSLTSSGNVVAPYFVGNGAGLTGIVATVRASTLTGDVLSANVLYSSLKVVDNLLYLNVDGNVTTSGRFIGSGAGLTNVPGANIVGTVPNAALADSVTNAAQPNITSVGTLTSLTSAGNVTAPYFIGNGSMLTGIVATNINANALSGDVLSANVLYSSLKSVGNLVVLNVDGNVTTSGRFIGSGAGLTNIPGSNVLGKVGNAVYADFAETANLAQSATKAVTVTANAQPNITSLGTLSSVSVTGNANVGRLNIGAAQVYLTNITPPTLALQADSVEFTNSISVTSRVTANGVLTSTLSASGNITGDYYFGNGRNLTGIVSSNVGVLPSLSVTGNTTTGNLITGGTVSAAGNITGGNLSLTGAVTATGNVTAPYFIGNGSLLTGIIAEGGAAIVNGNSNVVVHENSNVTVGVEGTSNVAVFANTGLYVSGLISATGNILGNAVFSDNYYYANGQPIPSGIVYTADTAPPLNPSVGDQWYDVTNDVLYEFISDGVSTYWVDVNSPAFAGGVVANVAISGNMLPDTDGTYNIGSSGSYFNTAYLQSVQVSGNAIIGGSVNTSSVSNGTTLNLKTAGVTALSIDSSQNITTSKKFSPASMPLGTIVQTVQSSSIGGSSTTATSYTDIASATVTITPSSATSRILLISTGITAFTSVAAANVTANTRLVRTPAVGLQEQSFGTEITGGGIGGSSPMAFSYLDSPATTSPVTYKLQQKISNSSSTITSTNAWLIAMEVTGS